MVCEISTWFTVLFFGFCRIRSWRKNSNCEGITGDYANYVVGGNFFAETQTVVSTEDVDSLKKSRLVEMHFICEYFDEKDEIDWEYVNARNSDIGM